MRRQLIFLASMLALVTRINAQAPDLLDPVVSRATDLAGPAFQSCGNISSDSGEDCFLAAYDAKVAAIGLFSVGGEKHSAAEARVLGHDGTLTFVSAYSDVPGITEYRCAKPFIAIEFGRRRVRCKEKYQPPLGAKLLSQPPTWLTTRDEHPRLLDHPDIPAAVCVQPEAKIIAQLLVDSMGHVAEVQIVLLPPGCSRDRITSILKHWRYSKPSLNGKPIATVEIITVTIQKAAG